MTDGKQKAARSASSFGQGFRILRGVCGAADAPFEEEHGGEEEGEIAADVLDDMFEVPRIKWIRCVLRFLKFAIEQRGARSEMFGVERNDHAAVGMNGKIAELEFFVAREDGLACFVRRNKNVGPAIPRARFVLNENVGAMHVACSAVAAVWTVEVEM